MSRLAMGLGVLCVQHRCSRLGPSRRSDPCSSAVLSASLIHRRHLPPSTHDNHTHTHHIQTLDSARVILPSIDRVHTRLPLPSTASALPVVTRSPAHHRGSRSRSRAATAWVAAVRRRRRTPSAQCHWHTRRRGRQQQTAAKRRARPNPRQRPTTIRSWRRRGRARARAKSRRTLRSCLPSSSQIPRRTRSGVRLAQARMRSIVIGRRCLALARPQPRPWLPSRHRC